MYKKQWETNIDLRSYCDKEITVMDGRQRRGYSGWLSIHIATIFLSDAATCNLSILSEG